ncbi:LOW QUALITY PROTEIN: hypothetical protein QYF61_017608 [Mycteria americana]|uniref:ribonuclease H n=1 Tax=Mycteria americana TaxID=33587 RepID=A0AAN7MUT0_MYCAM|nr:LOW QUALITY PROTEIN: hypothetical protein QYF61_017608 [Mycteria americana]
MLSNKTVEEVGGWLLLRDWLSIGQLVAEERTTSFAGLCGFDGLAQRHHRSIKLEWTLVHSVLLIPSDYKGAESICIPGVMGGSQELSKAEVSLTGNEWQKHPIATGPEAPRILGIDYLRRGYFEDPKGYHLPGISEDPSVVGLLHVKEQQVPIATMTVHQRQYHTNRESLVPIHKLIQWLESQAVIKWKLTVDYHGLNEVTLPQSAAVPDMPELQYKLESKAAKWYATIDISNMFFSTPLAAECRPQFAFMWRGIQYSWIRLPQGWKHSPTIFHGLIQTTLEQGEAPEHLQYIDDITVWGNTAEEMFEKERGIIQTLLKAGFTIKKVVKGPAQEIQFLGIKWQDGHCLIPMDVINKITAMSPPTNKKETQAFLGVAGFWKMHIPGHCLILILKHSSFWHLNSLCWAACSKEDPLYTYVTDAMWNKWVALIMQQAQMGNPDCPGILEVIADQPEG